MVYIYFFSRRTDLMSGDAQLSAMLSNYQTADFGKSLSLRSDLLFGAGGLQGGFLFWLDPVSVFASIGGSIYNHFFAGVICSILIFALTAKFFDLLQISTKTGRFAATLTSVSTVWGYSVALVDNELYGHVPQYASLMIVSLAILCCFLNIDGKNLRRDVISAIGFVISVLYLLTALTHLLVTALPLLMVTGFTSLIGLYKSRQISAIIRRLVLSVVTLLVLILLGAPKYLTGFYRYTAASEMPLTVYSQPQIWPPHKFLFETYFPTPSAEGNHYFQAICFLVTAIFLARGLFKKSLRTDMWFCIVLVALFLLFYRLWQTTWNFESGPRISYFIWMLSPIYAFAVASAFTDLAQNLKSKFQIENLNVKSPKAVAICLFVGLLFAASPLTSIRFLLREPPARALEDLSVSSVIASRVSLASEKAFRGRVAYVMQEPDYPQNIASRIPLLNEYSHTLSPTAYVFYERFILDDDSPQLRNRFILGLNNFKIYRMSGVRYLVVPKTRFDLNKKRIVGEGLEPIKLDDQNVLLDLGEPNLGSYSPTKVEIAETFAETFDLIESSSFAATEKVVLNERISGPFVTAKKSRLSIVNGDLSIVAESLGRSIILLPVEFSSCLRIEGARARVDDATLFRANGFLTAIVFDQQIDAKVVFRNGIFDNPGCRKIDLSEFRTLNS